LIGAGGKGKREPMAREKTKKQRFANWAGEIKGVLKQDWSIKKKKMVQKKKGTGDGQTRGMGREREKSTGKTTGDQGPNRS